ncbi:hypothetical protein [Geodermatophilus sp. SYSU D01105]
MLEEMAEDHAMISGIVLRIEQLAGELAAGTGGWPGSSTAWPRSWSRTSLAFEERRIREALDTLDGSAADSLGA